MKELEILFRKAKDEILQATSLQQIQTLKRIYINTEIKNRFKELPLKDEHERKSYGEELNRIKNLLSELINEKIKQLTRLEEKEYKPEDITLPPLPNNFLHPHPLTQTLNKIVSIFQTMAFQVVEGPEMETDYYNFEALNIPRYHPARDLQDTFYITDDILLRSHTSPVQIRIMEKYKPPIRIIAPGKVYRRDAIDSSHSITFYQVEGLAVDKGIRFSDLKGTLELFVKLFFGSDIKARFRPSYFPFTEPSAEMDIECTICSQKGCSVCKNTGWLELLGCGMVHPFVFKTVGYPADVTGFAFGLGVERFSMLEFRINDMRLFYQNDIRFLRQF